MAEARTREDVAIQLKGDPARPGDVVPRHFLTVLGDNELPSNADVSGREQLAEWILAAENPLRACDGQPNLATSFWTRPGADLNDFGRQGKPPTHPELLDYLAAQFRTNGWSIKSMHRRIMLSRSYQQSAARDPSAILQDPANEWLAGFSRRRLDAESIRDTLLVLGGNLDLSPAGAHPFPPQHSWDFTQHKPFKAIYESNHRSIYLMTQRIQRHPFLAIFDGADPSTSTAARMISTTPLQALYLLNDPFVHEQSRGVAERIMTHSSDTASRVTFACELLFARPPESEERASAEDFLINARRLLQDDGVEDEEVDAEAWRAVVRSLLRLNEFVYLD
ncbi:MAG: DUF1553 domain-containing protein [Planctomycetaceae bacterium]